MTDAGKDQGGTGAEAEYFRTREALNALRASEERFRATFNQAAMGMAIADLNAKLELVNGRFSQMLGYSAEELQTMTVLDITHPDDLMVSRGNIRRLLAGETSDYCYEKRYVRKDGTTIWSRTTVTTLKDAAGKPEKFIGVVEDITERREAERELQRSETRLQLAMEAGQMGAWEWVIARGEVTWSRTLEAIHGLEPGTFGGRLEDFERDIHPDDRERVIGRIQECLGGDGKYLVEYRIVKPDGKTAWIEARGMLFRDALGNPERMVGICMDISARKHAENALRESELFSRTIIESSRDCIKTLALDGTLLWMSDSGKKVLCVGEGMEVTGQSWVDFWNPEYRGAARKALEEAAAGRSGSLVGEVTVQGKPRWFDVLATPILDAWQRPERVLVVSRDVTERKHAEEARFRLAAVVESSEDAILSKSLDGIISSWNRSAQKMFGYQAQEIIGKPVSILIPADRLGEDPAIIEKLSQGEKIANFETVRKCKDGRLVDVSLTVSPIRDGQGRVIGVSKILRDITEKKRIQQAREHMLQAERSAREEAERLNVMKDEFLATLSHELRTPLSAILGWSQLLLSGKLPPEKLAQGLETIHRNARAQSQLIEDLLDMSRIVQRKMHMEPERLGLKSIVEAAVSAAQPAAQAQGVTLEMELEAGPLEVWGDANRMQQVMWNLVSNAVKFTGRGGSIRVRMRRVGSDAEVTVADTGMGISLGFLPYVFDRFRQGDSSTTRKHGGLGLGLSIVKHLVELHGGKIQADSPGEGKGATFTVTLPLLGQDSHCARPGAQEQRKGSGEVSLEGVTVLVVDDEADARELTRQILTNCRARVVTAESAAQGLELVLEQKPDVIVGDISMPGEDGFQFIRRIRGLDEAGLAKVPALALTAFARAQDQQRAVEAGYQIHLAKPVKVDDLVASVALLAGRAD